VTRKKKLLEAIRNNPRGVRFADACKAAELLSFEHKGGVGSHVVYARTGEAVILNFQDRKGVIYTYQARQLVAMIDKYGDES
jgi:hypothetical protein